MLRSWVGGCGECGAVRRVAASLKHLVAAFWSELLLFVSRVEGKEKVEIRECGRRGVVELTELLPSLLYDLRSLWWKVLQIEGEIDTRLHTKSISVPYLRFRQRSNLHHLRFGTVGGMAGGWCRVLV